MKYIKFKKNENNEGFPFKDYLVVEGDYDFRLHILSLIFVDFLAAGGVKAFLQYEHEGVCSLSCNLFVISKLDLDNVLITDSYPDDENYSSLTLRKEDVINLINLWEDAVKKNYGNIILYFEHNVYGIKGV